MDHQRTSASTIAPSREAPLTDLSWPFDTDAAVRELRRSDPALAAAIDEVGPFGGTLRGLHEPFAALLRAIAGQQLSTTAARTIHGRVVALYPDGVPTPAHTLGLPPEALRSAGLSHAKVRAVRDLADKCLDDTVPGLDEMARLSDEALTRRLCRVRGVGPWTAQMLLIFRLGRPDVLPAADLGIRKGVQRLDDLDAVPSAAKVRQRGEVWAPWRSVASWYLWRLQDA